MVVARVVPTSRYEYCHSLSQHAQFIPCDLFQGTIDSLSKDEQETMYISTAKDVLGVASSFAQLLLKKAPDVVDGNPVKITFGIAKIILQIKDVCHYSSHWCLTLHLRR